MKQLQWILAVALCALGLSGLAMAARPTTMTPHICQAWCGTNPIDPPDYEHICPEGMHCCLNANCAIMEFASACCSSAAACETGTDENGLPTAGCSDDPE